MIMPLGLAEGSYPGLNNFVTLVRGLQVNDDLDSLIGVSGFKGFGKSTFSKQFLIRYVEKYFLEGKNFTPSMLEKYTAYTKDDLLRLIDELPEYSPIDADEAVNFAMGEDWMKSGNKDLKKIMTKIRNKHHIFFFNIPDLWWLDKKYRETMMTIWVHIVKRGTVMVALPNIAPGIEDRWHRDWLQKAFGKGRTTAVNYFSNENILTSKLSRYPCFFDSWRFPQLPKPIYDKHLELRNAKSMEVEADINIVREETTQQRRLFKALPGLIRHRWPQFKEWYNKIMSNGKVPTDKYIYEFFYEPFKDVLKVENPEALNALEIQAGFGVGKNGSHKS